MLVRDHFSLGHSLPLTPYPLKLRIRGDLIRYLTVNYFRAGYNRKYDVQVVRRP